MKEAIILAGGLGTRLKSVVNDKPKCMAVIAGCPFLKYLFKYLEKEKFTHVILALGYKSQSVLDWISAQNFSFDVSYVVEKEPLGTGGAIKLALEKTFAKDVFVLNGDTFFEVDTEKLRTLHEGMNAELTLALKPMVHFDRYGSVELDSEKRVIRFNEKKQVKEGLINGGIYLLNKEIFKDVFPQKFSFETDIMEARISTLNIFGDIQNSYFIDIGIPSDYEKANIDFSKFD